MASARSSVGRKVARNTGSLLASRAVVAVTTLASLPIIYDGLGTHAFGVWALLGVLSSLVSLVDLGLGPAQIREVAQAHDASARRRARAALGLGLLCGAGLGLVALVATLVSWPLLARLFHLADPVHQAREAALWLMAGVLADQVSMPWSAMLAGTQRYAAIAAATGVSALLGAALAVLVIRLGGGLAALGAATAASSAIRATLLIAVAHRTVRGLSPRLRQIRWSDLHGVLGYGLPVQVTRAAGTGNAQLGPLVVGGAFGPAAVGGFDLGGRLLSLMRLPADLLFTVLFPVTVSEAGRYGREWVDRFYLRAARYLAAFAVPCAAVLVVCAQPLVRFWIGHDVPWAAASIAILAPGYAVGLVVGVATLVTRAEGRPARETAALVAALALNVALVYPLMRLCGPLGASVSTLVAVIVSNVGFFVHFHWATNRPVAPLLRATRSGAVAGVVAAVVGWFATPYLPDLPGRWGAGLSTTSRAVVVLLVAGVTLAASGFFDTAERAHLSRLLRRWSPTTQRRRWASICPLPGARRAVAPGVVRPPVGTEHPVPVRSPVHGPVSPVPETEHQISIKRDLA